MIWTIIILLTLWVAVNCAAPYAVLLRAQKISWGRLPGELLTLPQYHDVKFYMTTLVGGYGYSVWAPGISLVVFDKAFFAHASPTLIRYVVAHELAHFTCGHHRKRWVAIVTGASLIPGVRRWLHGMEVEADGIAVQRTGLNREMFPELGGSK